MAKSVIKTSQQKNRKIIPIILVVVAIIFAAVIFWTTRNQSLYSPNKDEVISKVDTVNKVFEISEELQIYADKKDEGCIESSVGWLGKSTQCSVRSWKFYKNNKDAAADLKKANSFIQGMGFKYTSGDLSGKTSATISYESFDGLTVHLLFFRTDERPITAAQYTGAPIDAPLGDNDYLIGMKVYAPYWSCSQNNVFQPCPTPPTSPKN
jgi:hypothetical protein